ncbi:hypothetical protein [Dactylosporangium salmoneum]|uniref:Uncharacterized protein n=1 Tax=Dactylosporangium salmoneum TaxID=53361 RepID=A0ABN3I3S0_9ACTN
MVAGGLVTLLVAAVIAGLKLRGGEDRPADDGGVQRAVAAVAAAPGVHARLTFGDKSGLTVTAELTVAADGSGAGTVTDPGGGAAEVRTDGRRTVVRADAAWWTRRAPGQVSALAGQWVAPKDGTVLPIDVSRALTPKNLAESIRFAAAGHPTVAAGAPWHGRPVTLVDNGDWSVAVTRDANPSVVWFGGHLTGFGPLQRAAWSAGDGRPAFVPARAPAAQPPQVTVALTTPDEAELDRVRRAAAEALPQTVSQTAAKVPVPRFAVQANPEDCAAARCQWSVTVINTGTAAGDATVIASAVPGEPAQAVHLGTLQPNAKATTPAMTFANPGAPGAIRYSAQVYSPVLDGPDPAARRHLQTLGIDPSQSPAINQLDPSVQAVLLGAADLMTRGRTVVSQAEQRSVLQALEAAVAEEMLPELRTIVASGRLDNPGDLAGQLTRAAAAPAGDPVQGRLDRLSVRRQTEFAARLLATDPGARVRLPGPDGGDAVTDVSGHRTYRISSITGERALPDLARPAAPAGTQKVAVLVVEPMAIDHDLERADLVAYLAEPARRRQLADSLCRGGSPAADELVIANGAGEYRWARERFRELADACP